MPTDEIKIEFKKKPFPWKKILPLVLFAAVVLLDQLTKILVVKNIPYCTMGASLFGDFLRIIHVSNPGIAFSIGGGWSMAVRSVLFRVLPLAVIVFVFVLYFRDNRFTTLQNWAIMGITGGGVGNLIDRFFRKQGVIDFIDVKFYGILGMERWPTFNVADAAVVVCGACLIVSFIIQNRKIPKENF